MQAVILAAGKSSRFFPFYNFPHKSCFKILGKSIIEHTLESIKRSGITDVIIVIGSNPFIKEQVGDGSRLGLSITYVTQPEPLGMGDALLRTKEYITGDFFLVNAAKMNIHEFKDSMEQKKTERDEIVLLAKGVSNPELFGVLRTEGDRVLEIVEKPAPGTAPSNLKVIGIYLLPKSFFDTMAETNLEEYNFERAISQFAQTKKVTYVETDKTDVTLKHAWDLLHLTNYLLRSQERRISPNAVIARNAIIDGAVVIEDGVKIFEGAVIKGPCYIGKNVTIGNNALVRNAAVLEEGSVVGANSEVKNSVFFAGTKIHAGLVEDSILGEHCRIGAFFCTANRRLDRKEIHVMTDKGLVNSTFTFLGVIMGNNVSTGARVTTMPGVVIGNNVVIGPSTTIMKNVEDDARIYTDFSELNKIVKKDQ